jgi:arylsulfatase A-like enzyme
MPGASGTRRIGGRFSQVDLAPTLLDLMKCDVPEQLDGASRAAALSDVSALRADDVFMEWHGSEKKVVKPVHLEGVSQEAVDRAARSSWRIIISREGWKLNVSMDDRCELYDLNSDPLERTNRIDEPIWRTRGRELLARIRCWQERTRDVMELPAL